MPTHPHPAMLWRHAPAGNPASGLCAGEAQLRHKAAPRPSHSAPNRRAQAAPTATHQKVTDMKLFYAPGACSIGIHALLEETGKPFEAIRLNLGEGDQRKPEFAAINPKSKVPALVRDDGVLVTEFPAIAWWIGLANPELGLIPADIDGQTKALSVLSYIAGTVHPQGFTRMFRPNYFTTDEAQYDAIRAQGADVANKGIALLSDELGERDYVTGALSVADYGLFYICWWKVFRLKEQLPANLEAHYQRMLARPAVQRALASEGFGG